MLQANFYSRIDSVKLNLLLSFVLFVLFYFFFKHKINCMYNVVSNMLEAVTI